MTLVTFTTVTQPLVVAPSFWGQDSLYLYIRPPGCYCYLWVQMQAMAQPLELPDEKSSGSVCRACKDLRWEWLVILPYEHLNMRCAWPLEGQMVGGRPNFQWLKDIFSLPVLSFVVSRLNVVSNCLI